MEIKRRKISDNLKYYFGIVRKDNPRILLTAVIHIVSSVAVVSITSIIPTLLIAILTQGSSDVGRLSPVIILFLTLGILTYIQMYSGVITNIQNIMIRTLLFGTRIYSKFLSFDYEVLESDEAQNKYRRANDNGMSNNDSGPESVFNNTMTIIINLGIILVFGIFITTLNPLAFVLILGVGILNSYLLTFTRRYREKTKEEWSTLDTQRYQLKRDAIKSENGKDARIYNVGKIYNQKVDDLTNARLEYVRKEANITLRNGLIGKTAILIRDIFVYSFLIRSVLEGSITIVEFTLFFSVMGMFNTWISVIVESIHKIGIGSQDLDDVRNFLEVEDTTDGMDVPKSSSYTLEFNHVSYRYPNTQADTLIDLNFTLAMPHSIALVGVNGAGKSTIVKLMLGLIKPTSGTITLNGIDITQFNRKSYFELFAPAFQENEIWALTLSQNVSMTYDEVDDDSILEILDNIGMMDVIEKLSNGIHTNLTTNVHLDGTNLSGGQSQKLMLARALYKDSPFLVLDEPTAALDALAEQNMYEKYHEYSKNKASLFISHRLSSTRFCDEVLFLENGEIIERGSHEDLLNSNGAYANMFKVQSQYYQEGEQHEEIIQDPEVNPIY